MKFVSIRPSKRLLKVTFVLLLSALLLPIVDQFVIIDMWRRLPFVLMGLVVIALFFDVIMSKKAPKVAINRSLISNLSLYQPATVKFVLANRSDSPIHLEWKEHLPNDWVCETYHSNIQLTPAEQQEHQYVVTPHKRGPAQITGCYLRVISYCKLFQITWFKAHQSEHKVYPNFSSISDLTGLKGSVNLQQMGLKKFNLRGTGMDFLQLRDYREGESLRQIDWRASSRFKKLISKEFQEEKNQHVVIMLDSGRRMRVQDDELSYFEHSLNALIMLSFTALKNGDNLSIQSFGRESRWLSQVRGAQNVSRIMHHFYDLYPEKIASDYLSAAQDLMKKHPKRSFIVLVTCLRDEDFDDLLVSVKILQEKHLVAVVSIIEPIYNHIENKPIESIDDALDYASSNVLQRSIEHNIKRLKHKGVICIQTKASGLTSSLINSYLSIKKAGVL
ncbi:DUF58 domain-containing protein [Glaciecola petra]|uniref:DUF58 domain-containing protein n=1 Tax=Glaciecola petra TaxID=3075602 RepID=A0ABU2ZQ51_9ALTE|nr:DUF58 domain-containing protein [Aestuariibacter sp. P117]MDT0594751.1 DUF58 domain-containing protein [Aestuariibacter sp. P117]